MSFAAAAFSKDSQYVAIGSKTGIVRVWKRSNPSYPLVVGEIGAPIQDIEFSPDGEAILARGPNWSALLDASSHNEIAESITGTSTFVRSGESVLNVNRAKISELARDQSVRFARSFRSDPGRVFASSADARWVVTQPDKKEPHLWDAQNEREPVLLRETGSKLTAAASSIDGKRLYAGCENGAVFVWHVDLDPTSLVDRLWKATPYCLTVPERMDLLREDQENAISNRKKALKRVQSIR